MSEKEMTIGELAKVAGVGVETIRFYEREGILKRPRRKVGSYRAYDKIYSEKIRFIKRAQSLGFTLKEIVEFLKFENSSRVSCAVLEDRLKDKIVEIEQKIVDLQRIKKSLQELSGCCIEEDFSSRTCAIYECFEAPSKAAGY